MSNPIFMKQAVLTIALAISASLPLYAGKLPNIVFLFADDQRPDTIAAHGNPHIDTPNLDRLAGEGFSFHRNYCAGSFSGAVCVASRAMLMNGRHWMKIGSAKEGEKANPASDWNADEVLPGLLAREAGYDPFIIGKWHNGFNTLKMGFSEGRSVYMGGMADHSDFQVQDLSDGKLGKKRKAEAFSSTQFANEAVRFIEERNSDKPFFLYVAFMAPHDPRNPPEPYRERYYNKRPPLPENFLAEHPFKITGHTVHGRDESLAPWPRTEEVVSDQLCEYYGLVTQLDEQVGRILTALKKSAYADDTIVIYTADHGLAMGSHGLLGKQNIYEHSMASPLIVSGPDIPKGESSAQTYIHDLYATLCDFAKIETPAAVDAVSILPLIRGEKEKIHDSIFLPYQDSQRGISDGNWKLHIYPKVNHQLLFNLSEDPQEMVNLAENPKYQNKMKELESLMENWREQLKDSQPLRIDKPASLQPSYDNKSRTLDAWQPKWIRDKYFGGREKSDHGKR
jgi:arylsulfatase A-like enzyme